MTIQTKPAFYYVSPIDGNSNLANFTEPNITGTIELTATFNVGARSPEQLMSEASRGFNAAGGQDYTVSFDRNTRFVTISSSDTFDILAGSGSNFGISIYGLLGFNQIDLTGQSSYTAQNQLGSEYLTQFPPQGFLDFDNNLGGIQPSVKESASGVVEVVTFGNRRLMEMELPFINSLPQAKNSVRQNNPTGLEDARQFMEFLITKSPLEYMKDKTNRSVFDTVLLERTRQSRTGTSYRLQEQVGQGFEEHYTTGRLTFRKL